MQEFAFSLVLDLLPAVLLLVGALVLPLLYTPHHPPDSEPIARTSYRMAVYPV